MRIYSNHAILTVNAGSSSLKFAAYPYSEHHVESAIFSGNISGLEPGGKVEISWTNGSEVIEEDLEVRTDEDPFEKSLAYLKNVFNLNLQGLELGAVAHRVVHGGNVYKNAIEVNVSVIEQLEQFEPLAPLHQPHNLEGIRVLQKVFPDIPHVACFDTSFHRTISAIENHFALPLNLAQEGVIRYGFHGLSYQFLASRMALKSQRASGRMVMAHLGNGSSLCAAVNLQSVASTMGFSAVDGLMMGTRCGSIDPGVLLYLLDKGWTNRDLGNLLYCQSGLKGVSGVSADMRTLRFASSTNPNAEFAIQMYTHRIIREMGAMIACSNGVDVIVFTGGIGEHDFHLRQDVIEQLGYLGVGIDSSLNEAATGSQIQPIHSEDSAVEVWVVPTDEGRVAAEMTIQLLSL